MEIENEPTEPKLFGFDEEVKKEATGLFYEKSKLLDKTVTIQIMGLGSNESFGKTKLFLECVYQEENILLPISKTNKNELLDLLGSYNKDNWYNQTVQVTGKHWKGDIEGEERTGVQLSFSK